MGMKKTTRRQLKSIRRRRLALALAGALAMPAAPALAQNLPSSGDVTSGAATIGQSGNQMTITQTSKGAIIDWNSFNIGAGYGVTFNQQFGSNSVTLNRVVGFGYSGSYIDGSLTSNGNVFIINPAGIAFGNGAVVNVGGLVASTLDISDADFVAGVDSGHYNFSAPGSDAGGVWNSGQITAANGGTVGLVGSYIENSGTITANNGSVVFGATQQVTLDFFGDGLTQVTVSGNGLGVTNCSLNCNGGITSSGNVFAQGGHIEMRSNTMDGQPAGNALFVDPANGGRIWISGNVVARTSGTRRGSIVIDAGQGNIDLGGVDGRTGNVSVTAINAGENAGTITLRGNQLFTHLCYGTGPTDLCVANNRLGLVNASAYGTGGSAGEIHIDVNHLYHGGLLQAVANDGSGGLIDIDAVDAEIYNWVFAYGNNGAGGTIDIDADNVLLFRGQQPWLGGPGTAYWAASLLAYGTTTGGTVDIDANSLVVTDLGNVPPEFPDLEAVINVTGQLGGNGGTVNINAADVSIDNTLFADASGEGNGGSIAITADRLYLYGGLVALGGSQRGNVSTTVTDVLFAGASAYVDAQTWFVRAPEATITTANGADGLSSGGVLVDEMLSATLDRGTGIDVFADGNLVAGATGAILIDDGVSIVHEGSERESFDLTATGSISGASFDIVSYGGGLDMTFTANSDGADPDQGYVSFSDASLSSNGGDVALLGAGRGVYLSDSLVDTYGGDLWLRGSSESTGSGVMLVRTDLASQGGDIDIQGTTVDYAGVLVMLGDIASDGGEIRIDGQGGSVGLLVSSSSSIDGGDGLVTLRAGNEGNGDSIMLGGTVASTTGVNLRPLDVDDQILLGAGNGFALSAAELALIASPLLVIGSDQHAGAIRVLENVARDGDLTLQNEGGSGGIDLQAAVDVGTHTLALASGGDIVQTSAGAVTAHSLLARSSGNVLLALAQNDVASTTLAGSAGGDFEFQDRNALAVGTVSAVGFNADGGHLAGLEAAGIAATGDVLVRTLSGDLTLNAGISGHGIDLVAAGLFRNTGAASLTASNGWRVWASGWAGEDRGGLAGSGSLPNLYGCTYGGSCAATAPTAGNNYFIYQQQPVALVTIANASREYGLANPAFTYVVSGGVLGDNPAGLVSGTLSSAATTASNVGQYAITGSFTSAAGYALQYAPGVLTITPATLVFTADQVTRYFGFANPSFTGSFAGFRNGDTAQSVFGSGLNIYSEAGQGAIIGYYPVYASGSALNYVIQQAPGNATALQVVPAPQMATTLAEFIGEKQESYVYETNIARDWMCPLGTPTDDQMSQGASEDALGRDWLKVRQRMQLSNCIDNKSAPGCRF